MNNNIERKVIAITGASSGLGEAAARYLSERGATVILGARRFERIQKLAEEINNKGGKALAVATDVTQVDQVKTLVDTAIKNFGRIDVLINNAGLMPLSPIDQYKIDEWNQMIDVNIKGIRVSAVCPGTIETPMVDKMIKGGNFSEQAFKDAVPIKRLGKQAFEKVPDAGDVLIADLSNINETKALVSEANASGKFDAIIHNAGYLK